MHLKKKAPKHLLVEQTILAAADSQYFMDTTYTALTYRLQIFNLTTLLLIAVNNHFLY